MNLKGKVVECVRPLEDCYKSTKTKQPTGLYVNVSIVFTDGTEVIARLIEPTLTNDVIPIGANSLGEGSV